MSRMKRKIVGYHLDAENQCVSALPTIDDGPRGIGELHRCVRRADGVNGVRFGLGRNTRLGQTECLKSACARARGLMRLRNAFWMRKCRSACRRPA